MKESEFVFTRPPRPGSQDVIVKVLWLSVDPYLRELVNEESGIAGVPVYEIGKPVWVYTLSKVMASDHPDFQEGDIAYGITHAANYAVVSGGQGLKNIDRNRAQIPLTHYLGVLGIVGHTSWVGLNIITQLKPNEEVFISAAAGAVGLLAGQLAKLKGCRVVGSVGSDEKVRMLKDVYNFDDGFNYKKEKDLNLALKRCFPNGFDVYFENVGGQMLEVALENIKVKGRIVACGMISQYNKEPKDRDGISNLFNVIGKSLKMEGFLVTDYQYSWNAFHEEVIPLLQQGKICYKSDVLGRGIEDLAKAFIGMLKGENIGKAVLFVSEE